MVRGEGWSLELSLYHSVARQLHPRDYPEQPTVVVLITPIGHPAILYQHMGCSHQSPKPKLCTKAGLTPANESKKKTKVRARC
jgi:hypothetical protein